MRTALALRATLALVLAPLAAAQFPCGSPGVEVDVALPVVTLGQDVAITLRNDSAQTIQLPSGCTYGAVFAGPDCTGTPVTAFGCPAVIVPIPPGQVSTQMWTQIDTGGQPLGPGLYTFQLSWWDEGFQQLTTCCVPVTVTSCQGPGTAACSPVPNSTGFPSTLCAAGSAVVADQDFTLVAGNVPFGEFGFFLVSATPGESFPISSDGVLCLSGNIGRLNDLSQLFTGPFDSVQVDLLALPQNPAVVVMPGDTWIFQGWHRDGTSSNFTNALVVDFL